MRDVKLNFAVPDPSAQQVAQSSLDMGTAVGEVLTHNVLALVIAPVCLAAGLVRGIVLRPAATGYQRLAGQVNAQRSGLAAARAQKAAARAATRAPAGTSAGNGGAGNGAGDPGDMDGDRPLDPLMSQA